MLPKTTVSHAGIEVSISGVFPDDHIFSHCARTGTFYEAELLSQTQHLIGKDDLVVDVGANIGNHSAFWARICGARVLAFEPSERCFAALKQTVADNSLQGLVSTHRQALGSKASTGRIVDGRDDNLGQSQVAVDENGTVRIVPLDEVVSNDAVHAIKIDVEGMELEVLKGARATIVSCQPIIFCECLDAGAIRGVEEFLHPLGYYTADVFNYSPTYMFIHSQWNFPNDTDVTRELQRSVGHLARELSFVKHHLRTIDAELARLREQPLERLD